MRKPGGLFDVENREALIAEKERELADPAVWGDPPRAAARAAALERLRKPLERHQELKERWADLKALVDLAEEQQDSSLRSELQRMADELDADVKAFTLSLMLGGHYDGNNAILSVHAGAGGVDAMDWTMMLLRMYTRWAESHGYRVETWDLQPGEEAGIKSATIRISGESAYGYLKSEHGVHRLVRISPFDASGRRHTSFASVDVVPELEDETEIVIRPEDIRVDTFRSGGAGGQHVNKTDSAVRITHLPTGIVVTCQNERSQIQNREVAMKILRARLARRQEEEQEARLAALRGERGAIAWGNQIRSYVFQPYTLVKDHRTEVETGNVQAVMDGELDQFIFAYLAMQARRQGLVGQTEKRVD